MNFIIDTEKFQVVVGINRKNVCNLKRLGLEVISFFSSHPQNY